MARFNPPASAFIGSLVRITWVTETVGTMAQVGFTYNEPTIGSVTPADLTELATAFNAACQTALRAVVSPITTLKWLFLAEIHYGTCPSNQYDYAGGLVGTAGTSSLPMEVAAIISRFSGLKGQHGRGRWFFPAVPDTFTTPATDPDVLDATATAAYGTLQALLEGTLIAASGKVWTPYIVTTPTPPAQLYDLGVPMTRTLLRETLSTSRRRRKGRGI